MLQYLKLKSFSREVKNYYKIVIVVGYNDRDLIQGIFHYTGKTKLHLTTQVDANVISVDSTVGFGTTGTIISGAKSNINYTSKSKSIFWLFWY